jgi:hypothetical protein
MVVAFRRLFALTMAAVLSVALDPVRSIDAFAVHRNRKFVLVATAVNVAIAIAVAKTNTNPVPSRIALADVFASSLAAPDDDAVAVDFPVAETNSTPVASRIIDLEDVFASSLATPVGVPTMPLTVTMLEAIRSNTTPVPSRIIALEDLVAFILSKNGALAVTPEEQVNNGTDLFASSFLLIASTSRRLLDAMDDAKPSTNDLVNDALSWLAKTVQISRGAFRYAITELTPTSSVPTAFLSPEILNMLSKQCPLIATTCEVDAMDDIKPSTHDSVASMLAWFATTLKTTRAAVRYAVNALTPTPSKLSAPTAFLSPEIIMVFSKQCAHIVTTCEVDEIDAPKPLVVLQALWRVSRYAITMLTIGSIAFFCILFGSWQNLLGCVGDDPLKLLILLVGTMVVALVMEYSTEAIWNYYWSVFIHVDAEAKVDADADDDVFDDAHDALEDDAQDGVAGQDDVPVEAPVAAPTIAAPLRRSKRVAAQQCDALRSAVTTRRSARLAGKPRVNYKH